MQSSDWHDLMISLVTGKEMQEKVERQSWKSLQLTMNDSAKFVDMLHNVPWEDGLPLDVVDAVEGYLASSREGKLGVTGEGTLLDNAQGSHFLVSSQLLIQLIDLID